MNMKRLMIMVSVVMAALLSGGCFDKAPSADAAIAMQQEQSMQEATRQTGLPAISNFKEKKMMKMLYELRDREDLICYAYLMNQMTGEVGQFLGKCIGYGLPASTQYSNPQKVVAEPVWAADRKRNLNYRQMHVGIIPQAEPNGLFMPEGLSATWLMMIDPDTSEPRPVYVEPLIIVSPFPLK